MIDGWRRSLRLLSRKATKARHINEAGIYIMAYLEREEWGQFTHESPKIRDVIEKVKLAY